MKQQTPKPPKPCKYCEIPIPPRAQIQCKVCAMLKREAHLQGIYDEVEPHMVYLYAQGFRGEALHEVLVLKFPAIEPRLFAYRKSESEKAISK